MLNDNQRNAFHPEETLGDSIRGNVEELEIDAVSSYGIWSSGRRGYRLTGSDLEEYVSRCILALLAAGATPSYSQHNPPDNFVPAQEFQGEPFEVVAKVISAWKKMGRDPDHGWVWFYKYQ